MVWDRLTCSRRGRVFTLVLGMGILVSLGGMIGRLGVMGRVRLRLARRLSRGWIMFII